MPSTFTAAAERALAASDPGRAVALAGRGLADGEPAVPLFRLHVRALTAVLERTGLVTADLAPGHVSAGTLRSGRSAHAVQEVVVQLQRALYGLAGAREPGAFQAIFRLAGALTELDLARAPRGAGPHPVVVSMLCCERPDRLASVVTDLIASDLPPSELVFFEDASRDARVLDLLLSLDAGPHRVHVMRNRGFSTRSWPANQNRVLDHAAAAAGGFDTFVTCDSDMALHPAWWKAVQDVIRAAGGLRLPEGRLGVVTAFQPEAAHPSVREATIAGVTFRIRESFGGCQAVVPREILDGVLGPLDHSSDWGWSARLRAAGRFVAATVPSHAQHLGESSLLYHVECDRAGDFVAG